MAITPGDYDGYDSITSVVAQVDSNETDFPYYIDLSNLSATWWSNVQSDGGDIRVTTNSDGTGQVPIEVVSIDTGTSTGVLHFKDSTDSTSSKTYYVWAGTATSDSQPAVTGTYGRNNVWTQSVGKYNLNETSGSAVDSSGSGNTGTYQGDLPTATSGKIGDGQNLDGTGDYITIADDADIDFSTSLTISGWFNLDVNNTRQIIVGKNGAYQLEVTSSNEIRFIVVSSGGNGDITSSGLGIAASTFYHAVATYDGSTLEVYVQGASEASTSYSNSISNTANVLGIGARGDGALPTDGILDDFRLSGTGVSSGWASTEYNMQSDNASFWTFNGWTAQDGGETFNATFFGGGL